MSPRAEDPEDVRVVVARLENMTAKLDEIHAEVKKTNGRVTVLERAQAIEDALNRRRTDSKDWTLRLLLAVVAAATLVEPAIRLAT